MQQVRANPSRNNRVRFAPAQRRAASPAGFIPTMAPAGAGFVPVLTFGPDTNLPIWKEYIKYDVIVKWPIYSTMWTDRQNPVSEQPIADDEVLNTDIAALEEFKNDVRIHRDRSRLIREQAAAVYCRIISTISPESLQKCKELPHWEADIATPMNPMALLNAIEHVHTGCRTGVPIIDAENARRRYADVRQKESESTMDFRIRFEALVAGLTAYGIVPDDQPAQAYHFIRALDDGRYHRLKSDIRDNLALGIDGACPATVNEAFRMANLFPVSERRSAPGRERKFVYAQEVTRHPAPPRRATPPARRVPPPPPPPQQQHNNNSRNNNNNNPPRQASRGVRTCFGCGEPGHIVKDCPLVREMRSNQNRAVATTVIQNNHPRVNFMTKVAPIPLPLHAKRVTHSITEAKLSGINLGQYDAILDSAATGSVVHCMDILSDVHEIDTPVEIKGVGGEVLLSNIVGIIKTLSVEAYYHAQSVANIIAFGEVESANHVVYNPNQSFEVITPSCSVDFLKFTCDDKGNGLYVANLFEQRSSDILVSISTVADNKLGFTKRQVKDAMRAGELIKRLGHPSVRDVIDMIKSGAIVDCPVTVSDVARFIQIHGADIASLKGKSVNRKFPSVKPEFIPRSIIKHQSAHVDIMFVDSIPFLVLLSHPLGLLLASKLRSRSNKEIAESLVDQLATLQSEGFEVTHVFCDGERGIAAAKREIEQRGIKFNPSVPGQHVPVIDRAIRVVKERGRAIITMLPYRCPFLFIPYLVYYCVMHINMMPKSTSVDRISPREEFTGRKINYKTDVRVSFGSYYQIPTANLIKNDVRAPRTEGAIALLPSGDLQGSVYFYVPATGKVVRRIPPSESLPIPSEVCDFLDALPGRDGRAQLDVRPSNSPISDSESSDDDEDDRPDGPIAELEIPRRTLSAPMGNDSFVPPHGEVDADVDGTTIEDVSSDSEDDESDPIPPNTSSPPINPERENSRYNLRPRPTPNPAFVSVSLQSSSAPVVVEIPAPVSPDLEEWKSSLREVVSNSPESLDILGIRKVEETSSPSSPPRACPSRPRYSPFLAACLLNPVFACHTSLKQALARNRRPALLAMLSELQQMLEKGVWEPVHRRSIPIQFLNKIISSFMFLKEKYKADGSFDKTKGRLVAGGHMQHSVAYDISSPTASLESVYLVNAIAAKEGRQVVTADVPGAYLNADMVGTVYMRLDANLSGLLVSLDPSYEEFLDPDGKLIVKLKKAIYGCKESAKLWYDHISALITKLGFIVNPLEPCIFNKMYGDIQCTICLYVDDLLITCVDEKIIDELIKELQSSFPGLQANKSIVQSYLGMNLDFGKPGEVSISMKGYTEDLLRQYDVRTSVKTPALPNLFEIVESPLLPSDRRELFHTIVAKLLYLALRTRPDILTAVAFLTTRVHAPTENDWKRLFRVLYYLYGTIDLGITLRPGNGPLKLSAYADASYGVHPDGKSHSGLVIALGAGPVFVRSSKQRIVSKSSTEAELISLSDSCSQVIWSRDFLAAQGYDIGPATIYQDNRSTMALADRGRSNSDRTRHIHIRYFFVKDRIKTGEISIEHMPTESMVADFLTKPLTGDSFIRMRDKLLNWKY
jgi:hypothetical protein